MYNEEVPYNNTDISMYFFNVVLCFLAKQYYLYVTIENYVIYNVFPFVFDIVFGKCRY